MSPPMLLVWRCLRVLTVMRVLTVLRVLTVMRVLRVLRVFRVLSFEKVLFETHKAGAEITFSICGNPNGNLSFN